ncbi:hypothetical protein MRS_074 [Staphylococcus phage MR003]|nr:hypothetical protein MRS_074 [Staphylococcus phage MR003]
MTKKKTHKEFVQDVYNLVGDEYTVIYAKDNNISLIRIPYYYNMDGIDNILSYLVKKVKQGATNQN